jgi:hypothetical protein
MVCELVLTLQRVLKLDPPSKSDIADALVENRVQDSLLDLLYRVESVSDLIYCKIIEGGL